jgi:hypothetical protein
MTNLIIALANIIENPIVDLFAHYKGSNRANNMGEALEIYIKDAFCNSFFEQKKDEIYNNFFSYLGNQNNPPDIIIKNGDAIEVKKIENFTASLALNSSYPKNKLYYDDSRITEGCKNCENETWKQKDIIYIVGVSPKGTNKLKAIWFIYGDCYSAKREIYTRIIDKISNGIKEISDVEFEETNELAKVKKVDPLGITDLRVRGMWHIANPIKVFNDFAGINENNELTINAIMLEEKYMSFPVKDRKRLESLQNNYFKILDEEIKSPDNPAQLLKAKFITYGK